MAVLASLREQAHAAASVTTLGTTRCPVLPPRPSAEGGAAEGTASAAAQDPELDAHEVKLVAATERNGAARIVGEANRALPIRLARQSVEFFRTSVLGDSTGCVCVGHGELPVLPHMLAQTVAFI